MKKYYKTLKLNNKEIETLKTILSKTIVEDMVEKSKQDYEDKVKEEYEKYNKLHKDAINCKKILDIILYLER